MKKNIINFILKFNNFINDFFSSFPPYISKIFLGTIYAFVFSLFLNLFGKNFIKTFLGICIIFFIFNSLNFITINFENIKETLNISNDKNLAFFLKDFFINNIFESVSFLISFSIFYFFLN